MWQITSQLDDCEVLGGELPRGFACEGLAREDAGIWQEVSFVEGSNYLNMVAKRPLNQDDSEADNWAVGDNLQYVAGIDFKKPPVSGRSDLLEMTLNSKGHNFWNLNGILDLNDLQALVIAGLAVLFLFFFVCGICCCCKARSAAKRASKTAPGESSNVNNEIHGMVAPDYNSNNLNDGTGVEDYAGFGDADTTRKVNQEET